MKVVVVEDQYLLREGLVRLLRASNVDVVAALGDVQGLAPTIKELEPDIIILDIRLPPTFSDEGLRAAAELRSRGVTVPVLLLSQYVELLYLDELLANTSAGVGYLLKDRVFDDEQFIRTIQTIAHGGTVIDPDVVAALMQRRGDEDVLNRLTPREHEVLSLMAEGHSNARISDQLFVTNKAVAKHINGILGKLDLPPTADASRRVQAVLTFLRGR